jgi:acyl-[acyl-carrier-protein]-phospholipid O-acyltransferase/long-chain-fatty-acid--[acyl-carrier-protein] ligase
MTTQEDAERAALVEQAKKDNIGEINVPRKVMAVVAIPVLGTGKTDYVSAQTLVETGP